MKRSGKLKECQKRTFEEMSKLSCLALIYLEKPSKKEVPGLKACLNNLAKL
jgi:hypothetical protein